MKQTEIGLIPEDWEVKEISSIKDKLVVGFVGTCEKYYTTPANGIVMLRTGDLKESYIDFSNTKYVTKEFHTNNRKSQLHKNDILIARHGSNGHGVLFESNIAANSLNIVIFHPDEKLANPKYTVYQLDSTLVKNQVNTFSAGSTQDVINISQIAKLKIPFPSTLAEQQRIAKALSDVDALISTTEKLIQKKKNIKQGSMQELLTGKKRLPGFGDKQTDLFVPNGTHTKEVKDVSPEQIRLSAKMKQTELGEIPEDWEVKALNELINDISDGPFGSNLKTEHYTTEREVRIIQLSNVGEDGWDNENVKYTTFTHAKEIQRCIVPYGSIVIAKMMPAGRAILCPNKEKMYILGSDCVRISPNNLLDSLFFMYFSKTSFYLNQIKENTQGSTRARTSVSKLKRIEIALPSKEEQTAIANVLSSMDKEIETLNTKLEKYRNLKTAMMQQLLTGKIRLVK